MRNLPEAPRCPFSQDFRTLYTSLLVLAFCSWTPPLKVKTTQHLKHSIECCKCKITWHNTSRGTAHDDVHEITDRKPRKRANACSCAHGAATH